eukprot:TRINITY_DN17140_c0_g1_i1.p1 TRINITY_DN17140_c0_g1~~TRINITY_DN17140_c0_g1_i1.p1  ORF type:complete len:931 (+),score=237.44 TRINITY_DN17140_c0_g1_i1:203-2794(+)
MVADADGAYHHAHGRVVRGQAALLDVDVYKYAPGVVRLTVDVAADAESMKPRFLDPEKDLPVLVPKKDKYGFAASDLKTADGSYELMIDAASGLKAVISEGAPFVLELRDAARGLIKANGGSRVVFEGAGIGEQPSTDGENDAKDTFGDRTDTMPHGHRAVGMDVSFLSASHLYGIPEHATAVALKPTKGGDNAYSEPYRLYNLDVFEYEVDRNAALYGAVPLMLAHGAASAGTSLTVGALWLNPSETWVDVFAATTAGQRDTFWISETGRIDVFFLLGPSPRDVFAQYAALTGVHYMPPLFSLAYHQCRWNYNDEKDVNDVDTMFDTHNIPVDVLWLDIEHTDGKRYFTWEKNKFANPDSMLAKEAAKGRKMVTIVDPHIKVDQGYYVYKEALDQDFFVKTTDGSKPYEGWCWPGQSSWLDLLNPAVRRWWAGQFAFDKYRGSSDALHIWNDMNEPSVFDAPEVTMPRDNIHVGGVEHRELHNAYGFLYHSSSYDGLLQRKQNERAFLLTRSFFAGSQRSAAVWTGDSTASWEQLRITSPMLLSLGIAGIAFAGSDVGGFFKNPDTELLIRWYQAGAFHPFFRAHAHIETRRREPWLFDEATKNSIRDAIQLRYRLLPLWYTLMYETHTTGTPLIRPLWVEFPEDPATFDGADGAFMVGSSLLVAPVTAEGQRAVDIYLPRGVWFDLATGNAVEGGRVVHADAPLERAPSFVRGGTVLPTKERPRRSSAAMACDPYTLLVAPTTDGAAMGELFIDDGHSFDFETRGDYLHTRFVFSTDEGSSSLTPVHEHVPLAGNECWKRPVVERLTLWLGPGARMPNRVSLVPAAGASPVPLVFSAASGVVTVKKPLADITGDWRILFAY